MSKKYRSNEENSKIKILLYCINFAPELVGIGKYAGEMTQWLNNEGHIIRVITGHPYYPQWKIEANNKNFSYKVEYLMGARVYRCPLWVPSNPTGFRRLVHMFVFAISSIPAVIRQLTYRPDIFMVIEPPFCILPFAVFISKLFRWSLWLHIQDLEIDAAFDIGIIRNKLFYNLLLAVERMCIRRCIRISTISKAMATRINSKGVNRSKIIYFPNWVDTTQIYPLTKKSSLRIEMNLSDNEIIVLYSGNIGEKQGLDDIIEAAKLLSENSNIKFIFCGRGAAYGRLRRMSYNLDNVMWIPLKPIDRLNDLLNLADIHLIPQKDKVSDLVMPSKLTGIFSSGRVAIATAPIESELARTVEGRGIVVPPSNPVLLAQEILRLSNNITIRLILGAKARQYAIRVLEKQNILETFKNNILSICKNSK